MAKLARPALITNRQQQISQGTRWRVPGFGSYCSAGGGANPTAAEPWRGWDRVQVRDCRHFWRYHTTWGVSKLWVVIADIDLRLFAVRGRDRSGTRYLPRSKVVEAS